MPALLKFYCLLFVLVLCGSSLLAICSPLLTLCQFTKGQKCLYKLAPKIDPKLKFLESSPYFSGCAEHYSIPKLH